MRLDSDLLNELLGQDGHAVVNENLLLAAGAVQVAKGDLQGGPLVGQHHEQTVGVEDVSAQEPDTRLFAKLAREANASKFCLGSALEHTRRFFAFFGHARFVYKQAAIFSPTDKTISIVGNLFDNQLLIPGRIG